MLSGMPGKIYQIEIADIELIKGTYRWVDEESLGILTRLAELGVVSFYTHNTATIDC